MEKRALLAVILSLLVIFVYQMLFLRQPGKSGSEEEVDRARDVEVVAKHEVKEELMVPNEVLGTRVERDSNQEIVVENHHLRVSINSRGGGVSSLVLKKYRRSIEESSPSIDLVEVHRAGEVIPLVFYTEEWREGDGGVIYRGGERYYAVLTETVVSLKSEGREGLERRYTFRPSGYSWDLEFYSEDMGNKSVFLALQCYLEGSLSAKAKKEETSFSEVVLLSGRKLESFSPRNLERARYYPGSSQVRWAGFDNKYFLLAVIPPPGTEVQVGKEAKLDGEMGRIVFRFPAGKPRLTMYSGPKDLNALSEVNAELERSVKLGWFGFIARPLLAFLKWLYGVFGNYGVAIIVLTVIIKLLFYPFTQMSMKSMKKMQMLQPLMAELREEYKDDRERLNRELLELYRREKVNPLGGCLPILIQIPIFIALYQALLNSIEIRHAPFIWWIKDLSAPERLFSIFIAGWEIPLRVLPLVMGISMYVQQKMTPQVGDPRQAQIMMLMPVFFTFIFWGFPSGLVLYWLVNQILSIIQQAFVNWKSGEVRDDRRKKRRGAK